MAGDKCREYDTYLDAITLDECSFLSVVAALLWYSIGVSYGTIYERWPIMKACRFALGAMAASGVPAPVCLRVEGQSDCQLGGMWETLSSLSTILAYRTSLSITQRPICTVCETHTRFPNHILSLHEFFQHNNIHPLCMQSGSVRGVFVGIYVIVGVPLFAFTLGQFAGMIVERAIREREMQIMSRPLGESEFRFALKLKKPSKATATSARSDNLAEEVGRKSANMPMSAEGFRPPYQQRPTPLSDQMGIPSASCRRCSINIPKGVRPRAYSESCINTTSSNRDTALPAQSNDEPAFSEFTIDFGEFVVLEMLRLRRVDEHDLDAIRDLFDDIDNDNSGTINEEKLTSYNQLLQDQNFELDEEVRGNLRPVSVSDSYAVAQRAPSRSCNEFDGGDGDSEPLIAADPSLRRSSSSCLLTIPEVSNVPVSSERKSELLNSSPPCRLSDCSLNDEKQIFLPKERDAPHASSFHMGQATTLDGCGKGHQLNDNNIDGLISKAQCLASSSAMIDDAEVQSENSTSTKGAGQNIRQSIAEDYNRLLLPILHMRHHGPSSGLRKSRQPESWFGTGNTSPDESFAVRRQSVDADALADSDSEDDCSGDKGTYGGRKGSDIRFKREMVSGETKEARETSGMWSISHLRDARNERFALSSKEEHHSASLFDSDLEHGHSSSFSKIAGFPGYGAMQTIEEENG